MHPNDGRVVSNFILQAIRGKDITVYGDGSQTRSFCYIDDLVRGITLLMKKKYHMPVNLGNPKETTVLELSRKVLQITGSSSKTVFKELPEDDPKRRCPDISLAGRILKWKPEFGLEEGLKETVSYFRGL